MNDLRKLIDHLEHIDRGGQLIRGLDLRTGRVVSSPMIEGEIGRKIGSTIGGIFGKRAGDRLGQIGSNIGDIFDEPGSDKSSEQDSDNSTGYVTKSGQAIVPPPGGMKVQPQRGAEDNDEKGVIDGGYKPYASSIFSVNSNLSPGGKYSAQIEKAMSIRSKFLGQRISVLNTYDYNGATLSINEYDAPLKHWVDTSSLGGRGDTREDWEPLGYKFLGSKRFDSSNKFGNCIGNAEKYKGSMFSSNILVAETTQLVAFKQPTGTPGMHYLKAVFCGPVESWQSGGLNALMSLVDSVELKGVVEIK